MTDIENAGTLSERDRRLLHLLRSAVCGVIPSATVFLYGSVARGTREADSDYDILVLADTPIPIEAQNRACDAIYDLELANAVVFSTAFHSWQEWSQAPLADSPFHRNVQQDAIVL